MYIRISAVRLLLDPIIDAALDMESHWTQFMLENPYWVGSYSYQSANVTFQMTLRDNNSHPNELPTFVYYDNASAKLYLSGTYM